MGGGGAQGGVPRAAQGYLDRLVIFVQPVVDYRNVHRFGGHPRGKGQGARSQGVIVTASRSGPAGHGIVHGNGLARHGGQGHRQLCRCDRLGGDGAARCKGHRGGIVVVLDGVGV